jgi:XTP/dITP diphosphohydrolase
MAGQPNRKARFRAIIALIFDDREQLFEGVLDGEITDYPKGEGGFGYDPIFKPHGSELTLAQMTVEAKNRISHRAQALGKMLTFIGNKGV